MRPRVFTVGGNGSLEDVLNTLFGAQSPFDGSDEGDLDDTDDFYTNGQSPSGGLGDDFGTNMVATMVEAQERKDEALRANPMRAASINALMAIAAQNLHLRLKLGLAEGQDPAKIGNAHESELYGQIVDLNLEVEVRKGRETQLTKALQDERERYAQLQDDGDELYAEYHKQAEQLNRAFILEREVRRLVQTESDRTFTPSELLQILSRITVPEHHSHGTILNPSDCVRRSCQQPCCTVAQTATPDEQLNTEANPADVTTELHETAGATAEANATTTETANGNSDKTSESAPDEQLDKRGNPRKRQSGDGAATA